MVKILENYLRRTPFHLCRYFQGFWWKCLEQLYGVGWIQRFTSISAYLVQIQENTNQKKLLIWTLLLRFTSKSAYSVRKIPTRKISEFELFSRSVVFDWFLNQRLLWHGCSYFDMTLWSFLWTKNEEWKNTFLEEYLLTKVKRLSILFSKLISLTVLPYLQTSGPRVYCTAILYIVFSGFFKELANSCLIHDSCLPF